MKKTLKDRKQEAIKAASYGEELVEFKSRGSSVFVDPDYGEFTCNYYSFLKGKSKHPKRRDYSHNKTRVLRSLSSGQKELEKANLTHLTLLEWDGMSTGDAIFLDDKHGKFEGTFRDVVLGRKHHQERKKENRSKISRDLWKDEEYREKTVKLIKEAAPKAAKSRQETMEKKYGVKHALQNENILKKQQKTMLSKFGVKHYAQTEDFKKWHASRNPFIFSGDSVYKARVDSGHIKTFSGETMSTFAGELGKAYTTFQSQVKKYGIDIALEIKGGLTSLELAMQSILDEIECTYSSQEEINQYKADFVVNKKLVIEVDGLFWYSDFILKDSKYHSKKKALYKKENYKSVFFREHEVIGKKEIVKSIILNKLGFSERVYARKTEIKKVPKKIARDFLNNNHLMGAGGGASYGLYLDNTLITLLQIRKQSESIKIERFCHSIGMTVVGGYSKLLKYIEGVYTPESIVNFIDKRYGDGEYLKKMGFIKKSEHLSFSWTDFKTCHHRMTFPGNSGYEAGYKKIWDCGQAKYVKKQK